MLLPFGDRRRVRWLDALMTPYDPGCVKIPKAPNDRHKMTSLCHLLQFFAIGVYAIIRRDLVPGNRDLVRGILRDRPVARGRIALQVAARRLRLQWIWSLRSIGIPLHGANVLTEVYTVEQSPTVVNQSSAEVRIELTVLLPPITAEQLRQRGALRGISGSTLASELLVAIAAMAFMTPCEMSEIEELEYKRTAFQILSSILGELVPDFWKTLIDQWEQEGRPGVSPVDRQYLLDELSKMATEWLQARNTLH